MVVVSGFLTALALAKAVSRTIQQPNRSIKRRQTQVHVALRRANVLVSGQFLVRLC